MHLGAIWAQRRTRLCGGLLLATALVSTAAIAEDWKGHGFDAKNTANNPNETAISPKTVASLGVKWKFTTGGDVSARAAVADGMVYFPDWGGNLWAVNAKTGDMVWGVPLATYLGSATPVVARATPTISNGMLYIGLQTGAWFLALDAANGHLIWKKQLDTTVDAIVTTGAVVVDGVVYAGVANTQEGIPGAAPGTARGSVVAMDRWTGAILWKTYTLPAGYQGVGVWGSTPVVDVDRGLVFVGTGDNYNTPTDPAYVSCIGDGGTAADCQSPKNHVDSILALDIHSGKIRWSYKAVNWNQQNTQGVQNGSDFFNLSCIYLVPGCPSPAGPDYDFGQGPSEITYDTGHGMKTILGAGQKSGIYYAFEPETGKLLWSTQVGPGSSLGGMEWGSATDGKRIYVAITNYYGIPWGGGNGGFWAALDPATGKVLWQTADPNGAVDLGPVAVANGVVYVGSTGEVNEAGATVTGNAATAPTMLALDAATGKILWSFDSGSSVISGAAIANGSVYWGTGYTHLGLPGVTGGNNTFYGFSLDLP